MPLKLPLTQSDNALGEPSKALGVHANDLLAWCVAGVPWYCAMHPTDVTGGGTFWGLRRRLEAPMEGEGALFLLLRYCCPSGSCTLYCPAATSKRRMGKEGVHQGFPS
jgi:hypothetical protein